MKRIVDWYWNHAENRPEKWSISTAGLNNIMGIANRNQAIKRVAGLSVRKPCIAFWGPSQSGKSSFLSKYIDGAGDGNLALQWSPMEKVRFSPSEDENDPNCVVFNPFHGGMDASGLVTRFYLPTDVELREIDPDAPVEILLATQKQILHSLAVGYRMECAESENPWTMEKLLETTEMPSQRGSKKREAYELLYDVCDVCESLALESQKYSRFARGTELRRRILQSSYVDDYNKAMSLASYLLWDGELPLPNAAQSHDHLRDLFVKITSVRDFIKTNCANGAPQRVFASMRTAALLEDIGALSFYVNNQNNNNLSREGRNRINAINSFKMVITPRGVILTSSDDHYNRVVARYGENNVKKAEIRLGTFGRIQALIGELKIPIKRTACPESRTFFDFLNVIDLLDIPGVTNTAAGNDQTQRNKINLNDNPSEIQLLSQLYKSGKTLSVVYGQAETCSIDSFVVFVDLEPAGGIRRPATLVNGIRAWLKPFGFTRDQDFNAQLPLKLYLNCSLFGKIQDKVLAAIHGGGLSEFCDKARKLDFAGSRFVGHFFTSNIYAPCQPLENKTYFENDTYFKEAFLHGVGSDSLNAVYADGLGTDFMLRTLRAEVTTRERLSHYEVIKEKDKAILQAELTRVLPGNQGAEDTNRRAVMRSVFERATTLISPDRPDDVKRMVSFVKHVFFVDENLENVPASPYNRPRQEIKDYLKRQIRIWIDSRKDYLSRCGDVDWLVHENEMYPFLESLAAVDVDTLADSVARLFWRFNGMQGDVSHSFVAMILNNCFMWGGLSRPDSIENGTIYDRVCKPFIDRVESLSTVTFANEDGRPENLSGDEELVAIANELNLV